MDKRFYEETNLIDAIWNDSSLDIFLEILKVLLRLLPVWSELDQ
jgi:hypothetical protein